MSKQPRTVVVTGAAGGLGRAFAEGFADRGDDVVVADLNLSGAEETAALLEAKGARALAMQVDVTDVASTEALAAQAAEFGGGGVDVGAPTFAVKRNTAPEVDASMPGNGAIAGLAIGDATIVPVLPNENVLAAASGMTATTTPDMELEPTTCDAYVVTVTSGVITAAAPWDGTLTPGTYNAGVITCNVWSFTVPALTFDLTTFSGQALYLYMH